MRTTLAVLVFGLLLGGGALAEDDVAASPLDDAAKEALRQELLATYRTQTDVNLAWDVVFTPGENDERAPGRMLVEAFVDGTNIATRITSTTDDWSIDAVATEDRLYLVKGDLGLRMPGVRTLDEGMERLAVLWESLIQRFDVELRPASVPKERDEEPYRVAFGFIVDEAEDDSIDFDWDFDVERGAEPTWLTEELFGAKDVFGPTGGQVTLRSARAELQIDVATGMLLGGRVTKERTGGVMTVERSAATVTPEAWQERIQAVLARPADGFTQQFSHGFFAIMASGVGFWVACTTPDPDEQMARLRQSAPELVAATYSASDTLSAIEAWIGEDPGEDEKAGIAYLLADRWVADYDRITGECLANEMLEDAASLPEGLDADAAWARTRQAFRDAIRAFVKDQVEARWPRK